MNGTLRVVFPFIFVLLIIRMKLLLLTLLSAFCLFPQALFAQTVLLHSTFETAEPWLAAGTSSPNNWITGTCAGNGGSEAGSNAAYITTGGTVPGCGPTGISNYSYTSASSGSHSIIYYTDVNASCAATLSLQFDARTEGIPGDFLEPVYSTDHGVTWTTLSAAIQTTGAWQASSLALPSSLNNSAFLVGFRFTYDNATVSATAPAIDNIQLTAATFTDGVPPVVVCPPDTVLQLNASCQALAGDYRALVQVSDICSYSFTRSQDVSPTAVLTSGANQPVTITVTDQGGNTAQCSFLVTVTDTIMPVITCPANQSLYASSGCNALLADYTSMVTVTDNCSTYSPAQSPVAGTSITAATTVTMTVTVGAQSRSCSFSANLIDTIRPVIACPATKNVYADAACMAIVPDLPPDVTRTDNCTSWANLVVTQNPPIGSFIAEDSLAVVTVTDAAGNQKTCTTLFIFNDTISPLITCPAAQTVSPASGCDYTVVNFGTLATASDNCTATGSLAFSQLPIAGSTLPVGTHNVQVFVQDATGNSRACTFSLTVTETTLPVVVCPPVSYVPANASCTAQAGNLVALASATDNCTATNQLVFTQIPAPSFNFSDTITVQVFATDLQGNTGSCIFQLIAEDTVQPVVSCLSDTAVAISNPCNYLIPDLSATYTATDGCSSANQLSFQQSPPAGTSASGISGVAIIITDAFGNSSTCVTQVTPLDVTPPAVICSGNQVVANGSNCSATLADYTNLVAVTDNCSSWTVVQTPSPGTVVFSGTNSITLTVTDAGQNETSCTFSLLVAENVPPSIACPSNITTCNPSVVPQPVTVSDNCLFKIVQTDNSGFSPGDIYPVGTTTQTYTIIDSSGNSASCSYTIQVFDYPDTATITENVITLCNSFTTSVTAQAIASGTGSWSVLQGTGTLTDPSALSTTVNNLSFGVNKIKWTVTSAACGSKSDTVTIIVTPLPSTANVQDSINACSLDGVLIQTLPPVNGTGMWTGPAGVTFDDPTAPIAYVSNLGAGYNTLVWTISNGTCPVSSDSMVVYLVPGAEITQADTTLCLEDLPFQLTGTTPVENQSSIWNTVQGQGYFDNKYVSSTSLTSASIGEVKIVYYMNYAVCGSTTDTLTLVIVQCDNSSAFAPTLFTPNADGDNDYFEIPNLSINYPECEVTIYNRWGGTMFESTGYNDPWDGTYKDEPVPMGTYFYRIELHDNEQTILSGSISIIR